MKGTQMRTPMSRVRGLGAAHTGTQAFLASAHYFGRRHPAVPSR